MSKPLDLYYIALSGPCRLVMLTIRELGIEDKVNVKIVDLMNGEHLKPEFIAINPHHCVPTLVDNESKLTIWESRAIASYLINKYKPGSLLPTDLKERALVDRHLYFDAGSLYPALANIYVPIFKYGKKPQQPQIDLFKEKLKHLDAELKGKKYLLGDSLTLADLGYLNTMGIAASIKHLIGLEGDQYPNLHGYLKGLKESLPYYSEVVEEASAKFGGFLTAKYNEIQE